MTKVQLLTWFHFKLSQLPFFALRNSEVVTLRARQQCVQCAKSISLRWKRSNPWTRERNQQRKHEKSHSQTLHVSPPLRFRKIYMNHIFEIAYRNRLRDSLKLDVRFNSLRSFSHIVIKTDWTCNVDRLCSGFMLHLSALAVEGGVAERSEALTERRRSRVRFPSQTEFLLLPFST